MENPRFTFFCYIRELLASYNIIKKFASPTEIFSHTYATVNADLMDLFRMKSKASMLRRTPTTIKSIWSIRLC